MIENIVRFEFLQNAFLTGIMIGFLAPFLGVFIVVRRLSLIADALSHITLAGIAAGLLIQAKVAFVTAFNPLYTALLFSVIGSLLIEKLRSLYASFQELSIPIILSGGIGLSVIFISLANGFNQDLFYYLFGSINAISRSDMWTVFAILIVVSSVLVFLYKELVFLSFDEEHAKASGMPTKKVHFVFIVIVALVIAASMRIVGIMLVSALMTLPVATSIRIAKGFKETIVLSIVFGELAVVGGLVAAYYLELPSGGTIVMVSIALLCIVLLWKKVKLMFVAKTAQID
ncbi:metal ABC transporter permease [Aureibacillus halotolerans]|uniref:Zinc transport system permease protein n=1 Tax=Aureibacillus halotolerans TaxID=1508390 RepID=A0A4R6U9P7_9BACI|nr:metal ABC transporter permease [Aureibacillus halotolerans]TDQ41713.1 zinc transport system permease protein [Aureibacillus halotolerans]